MTMRYLATGCLQRVTADFVGVSTSSANRIIHQLSNIIASSHKEYIKFPKTEVDIQTTEQKFYAYCQFPGIIVRMFLFRPPLVILQKYTETEKDSIPSMYRYDSFSIYLLICFLEGCRFG